MAEHEWRAPRHEDDAEWAALLAAIESADQRGETYELEDLADEWASVWAHPDTDAVHVWDGPELVAFGWIKRQAGTRDGHKLDCWGGVRPDHRRRGLGRAVLRWQVARCREVAGTLDPSLPAVARVEALDTMPELRRLAEAEGFRVVRTFLELARPLHPLPDAPPAVPEGLRLLPWSTGLDEAARAAHAESFADHWGSEPRSVEEWRQWYTGHRAFRPDLSWLLVDDAAPDGEEVAAFALCSAYPQDWHAVPREVWVQSLGTRRAWRGRGAARAALEAVLGAAAAADDGFERAILGVDAENPTGAVRLYRSLGFDDVRAVDTLALPLP